MLWGKKRWVDEVGDDADAKEGCPDKENAFSQKRVGDHDAIFCYRSSYHERFL